MEWGDPYRTERIYKALQGRDQLTPKDMLTVQTDVYSEVDQEMGQRFAYAIDHANGVDDRLRKAADLMRSWDGRLTTDSAAASLVTQARQALWPLILTPKLGKDAGEYKWAESDFAEEEIVMHASLDWLPHGYKDWDALLTDAVRKGMEKGKAPGDVAQWTYGSWHVVDIEHPLTEFLPLILRVAGTGAHPQSGDTTTVKQVGRAFGPSQRFTMDWSDNRDGSTENIVLGEIHSAPTSATSGMTGMAEPPLACPSARQRSPAIRGTPCVCCREFAQPPASDGGPAFKGQAGPPLGRPCRHPAGGSRGHRAATDPRQLLRARFRFPHGFMVRRAAELETGRLLSPLDAQCELRRRRAAFRLLSSADMDAGRGLGPGDAVDLGRGGVDVSAAGRHRTGDPCAGPAGPA